MKELRYKNKDKNTTLQFFSNYWVDELSFRLSILLDFTILGIVLFAYSYLVGDVININLSKPPTELKGSDKTDWMNNRTLILSLKVIMISIIISVFTFTITNTIPSVYESYKLDIQKTRNKQVVETNRRKLVVIGNFINSLVLISIIVSLLGNSRTSPIFMMISLVIVAVGFVFACITSWKYGKRKEAKQNLRRRRRRSRKRTRTRKRKRIRTRKNTYIGIILVMIAIGFGIVDRTDCKNTKKGKAEQEKPPK